MISIRQLRCIAALDETLHFHRAAERCHISQPALSNQIRQMEEELGVVLVERSKRRVMMTQVGHQVAERAKAILRDIEELKHLTRGGEKPLSGTLRMGVLPTLGPYLLPHILPALIAKFPDLKLYLREEPVGRLVEELMHGDLDLLLVSLPQRRDDITVYPMLWEPFWAALPISHPLAAREELELTDLKGEMLILLERGDCLREGELKLCQSSGAGEHPDFRATSLDSLRQMVATGLGATVLPALYVNSEARKDDKIAVRPFRPRGEDGRGAGREIDLVWRRTSTRAAEFRMFAELIRSNLPDVVTLL
ncbi:LysR substrate-binding domain-containing protein [Telmatospirillum sp. J64-1]|uniref:LysR substrate-binding domain-containing protein n=1 Tax=Telmatospirillum sp. J64-1 TaxID=2502183 RepID=UPI00163D7DCB|nr:LysR substrate-binding domain-containing protein [Telmatospirillum sp. J64-1]